MLHWIGWIGLLLFGLAAVAVAVWSGWGAYASFLNASKSEYGSGYVFGLFGAAVFLFASTSAVLAAVTAHRWRPWE